MPRATDIIDPKTAGTIAGLFRERVRRTPHASAYRHFNIEERRFKSMSWNEMFLLAARWQGALEREGLHPGPQERTCLHRQAGVVRPFLHGVVVHRDVLVA